MADAPILLDLTHTSHTRARTGIQRTARALWRELGALGRPICHDPFEKAWRPLEPWELANLADDSVGGARGADWPAAARWRGRLRRLLRRPSPAPFGVPPGEACCFLSAEIFSPSTAAALPSLLRSVRGPRAALFFDAIALQYPEFTPEKSVARYPAYLQELTMFDGVAANSEASRAALADYWKWLGIADAPPVAAITPAPDPPGPDVQKARAGAEAGAPAKEAAPVVLCVGTIEGRKNQAALLEACESLWARGLRFELRLIGMPRPETGRAALEQIARLRRAGRPLRYDGAAGDSTREEAYAEAAFTVYPSLVEGFGLPVAESLSRGKPCICSGRGALGELARGGGCLEVDPPGPRELAAAIQSLLADPARLAALAAAARARRFKTWKEYSAEVADWIAALPRRIRREPIPR
jgi:glycosyltransferase involved in cell wall biosynthesis